MSGRAYLSIGDVLTLLREEFPDVTISKIRFLESQRLVNPERSPSGYRKFYEPDVERLRWVLRQQRDHFLPLKVIRDRLARAGNGVPEDAEDAEEADEAQVPTRRRPQAAAPDGSDAGAGGARAAGSVVADQAPAADVPGRTGEPGGSAAAGRSEPSPSEAGRPAVAARVAAAVSATRLATEGSGNGTTAYLAPHGAPGATSGGVEAEQGRSPEEAEQAAGDPALHRAAPEREAGSGEPALRPAAEDEGAGAAGAGTAEGAGGAAGTAGAGGAEGAEGAGTAEGAGDHEAAGPGAGDDEDTAEAPVAGAAPTSPLGSGTVAASHRSGSSGEAGADWAEAGTARPAHRGGDEVPGPAGGSGVLPAHARPEPPAAAADHVPAHAAPEAEPRPAPAPAARPTPASGERGEGEEPRASGASLTLEELCTATGLPAAQIASLESFGLIEPITVAGGTYYDGEAVTVATLAAELGRYGIEPRHLRIFRNAVDREMGLVEQVVAPLLRQRNPAARQRAVDSAHELAQLGEQLRASLVRRELRRQLGR